MLKNPIIKVHFHGVEVQIQHIPDNHMIVNINGTSTLIPIHEFQRRLKRENHLVRWEHSPCV